MGYTQGGGIDKPLAIYRMDYARSSPPSRSWRRNLATRELEARYPQLRLPPVAPHLHNPQVAGELEKLILRSLDPDPRERFQSVSGMLAALAPMLKGRNKLWPASAPI